MTIPVSAGRGYRTVEGLVHLDGQVAVINAGPAPVTVRGVKVQGPGILIRDIGQSQLLPSGGTVRVNVKLQIECSIAYKAFSASMQLSVETNDKRVT